MKNDSDHAGPGFGSPLEWIVYAHVYISGVEQVTIQYWFFWPYNDQFNNHEGDWEHINVVVNVSNEAYPYATQLVYWHHTTYTVVQPSQVQWVDTYHPRVFTASGSHANYPNKSSCDSAEFPWGRGCSSHAAEQWWTWADGKGSNAGWQGGGTLNMGERNHPFFSMDWIDYGGRWGELGTVPGTSGPPGPAAKEDSIWFQ
ncbi:MAG: hypothetical protein MJD61_17950 [Proteobacteria bacterium]|nr:hypothetical protein [Pseudomonadota bacterium]